MKSGVRRAFAVKSAYGEKLRDPRWQKKRLEILQRDAFTCRLCGDSQSTLHVHHLRYERGADPWDYPSSALLTTCESCHENLHGSDFAREIFAFLLAGGATWETIGTLHTILDCQFANSPKAGRLTDEGWARFIDGLEELLSSLQPHMTEHPDN